MGLVKMSGVVKGVTEPVPWAPPANFADATWSEVIKACELNLVPATWEIGDQKVMTINGTDYLIDIIGKNHDTYADGSGYAPLTFQMHDCYATTYAMNDPATNVNGYGGSQFSNSHVYDIYWAIPSEIRAGIKEVVKYASLGGGSSNLDMYAYMLFLLSEVEVAGSTIYSVPGEGEQYAYYAAGNRKVKKTNGSAGYWWLRSPASTSSTHYAAIDADGRFVMANANGPRGISLAFCF